MNDLILNESDDFQSNAEFVDFNSLSKTQQKYEIRMKIEDYQIKKSLIKQLKEENIFWDEADLANF